MEREHLHKINKISKALTQLEVLKNFVDSNEYVDIALIERTSNDSKDWSPDDKCIHFNLFPTRYNGGVDFRSSFSNWLSYEIKNLEEEIESICCRDRHKYLQGKYDALKTRCDYFQQLIDDHNKKCGLFHKEIIYWK